MQGMGEMSIRGQRSASRGGGDASPGDAQGNRVCWGEFLLLPPVPSHPRPVSHLPVR